MNKFSGNIAAFIVGISATFMPAVATADWSIAGLGTLGGTDSSARGINDSGQVVGSSTMSDGSSHAFITGPNGAGMTDLGTLSGTDTSFASGINDSGQVVGTSYSTFDGRNHAFITRPNGVGMTDLGIIGTGLSGDASGINNSGQVTGYSKTSDGRFHAFVAKLNLDGSVNMTSLVTPGDTNSYGRGINDSGQLVGEFLAPPVDPTIPVNPASSHIFITGPNGAGMTDLVALDGLNNSAAGINNSGQVAGTLYVSGGSHPFITGPNGVGVTDLGTLGGNFGFAYDINDFGQVVGIANIGGYYSYHALLYSPSGEILDLSSLPAVTAAGWTNLVPSAINNHGQIVGYGFHHGHQEAFLLSAPVPESQTYAMLLAGLGVLGFITRRKKESIA